MCLEKSHIFLFVIMSSYDLLILINEVVECFIMGIILITI